MTNKPNILVLCTGNSCRSQMAEGYLKHYLGNQAQVYSAGVETHGLNLKAIAIMKEDGIDISHHTSNHVDEYKHIAFDYVFTVCDHAQERCPVFPSKAQKLHHNFTDPAKAKGSEEEIMASFRSTRNLIKEWVKEFSKDLK
jgi:arsenate reductase